MNTDNPKDNPHAPFRSKAEEMGYYGRKSLFIDVVYDICSLYFQENDCFRVAPFAGALSVEDLYFLLGLDRKELEEIILPCLHLMKHNDTHDIMSFYDRGDMRTATFCKIVEQYRLHGVMP